MICQADEGDHVAVQTFALVVDAMGPFGRHAASQLFLWYQPPIESQWVPFDELPGTVLRAVRDSIVLPHAELTSLVARFQQGGLGKLHFMLEHELVECMLGLVPAPSRVTMRRLTHEPHFEDPRKTFMHRAAIGRHTAVVAS
jgi:hypothetical protein